MSSRSSGAGIRQQRCSTRDDFHRLRGPAAPVTRVNTRRSRGAMPRLRGRGERSDPLHTPFLCQRSVMCRSRILGRCPALQADISQYRSQNNIAQGRQGYDVTMFPWSPRPRKRGSAPRLPAAVNHEETASRSPRDVEHFRVLSENAARA